MEPVTAYKVTKAELEEYAKQLQADLSAAENGDENGGDKDVQSELNEDSDGNDDEEDNFVDIEDYEEVEGGEEIEDGEEVSDREEGDGDV